METPSVTCVMLTANRPDLAPKAVACFLRQTYENKALLIYDTGEKPLSVDAPGIAHALAPERGLPIGALRNNANRLVSADIIIHFDDDDWSHPNRISEQVALLQQSGADTVGYNEMLFWRGCPICHAGRDNMLPHCPACGRKYDPARPTPTPAESWLYSERLPIGTSLCYWRKTWEAKQFRDDLPKPDGTSEYYHWLQDLKIESTTAQYQTCEAVDVTRPGDRYRRFEPGEISPIEPRMIARIHGGNTSSAYSGDLGQSTSWKRVPDWDESVRKILEEA